MPDKMLYSVPVQIGEVKSENDDWIVEGYPSTFDNVDLGGDVIRPGAFTETLKSGPKVRLLMAHDQGQVLGVPRSLKEDKKGLYGSFKISKTQLGTDAHQLLLDGAIDSFSIGYRAKEWSYLENGEVRELKAIDLYEVSLVAVPMNQEAVVTRVKEYATLTEQVHAQTDQLKQLLDEIRGLANQHPLNEKKRQELAELLEMFSGMDEVRSGIQSVLSAAHIPAALVESHRVRHQLAELRKRYEQPKE